ncbi:hypothetical protein DI291_0425 [Bacillus paralicheniformis]|nr:hypothetical protein DI291_0425 [Bacillus paralicheniformis]
MFYDRNRIAEGGFTYEPAFSYKRFKAGHSRNLPKSSSFVNFNTSLVPDFLAGLDLPMLAAFIAYSA